MICWTTGGREYREGTFLQGELIFTGVGVMIGSYMIELLHPQGKNIIGIYYKLTIGITELSSKSKC